MADPALRALLAHNPRRAALAEFFAQLRVSLTTWGIWGGAVLVVLLSRGAA